MIFYKYRLGFTLKSNQLLENYCNLAALKKHVFLRDYCIVFYKALIKVIFVFLTLLF